jgi:hypothetical protein
MIDFTRFWTEHRTTYQDQYYAPGAIDAEVNRGVTADAILAWERQYGVTLPEPIRTVLGLRNGGCVRNCSVEVLPLGAIVPADDDFWDHTDIDEDEVPEHNLMFAFGSENQSGGTLLMNFNANGPEGAPSVYIDYHGESSSLVSDTIIEFFEAQLAASPRPSVDWSVTEARRGITIIARETIDLSALYKGKAASEDQVLARVNDALVLFKRQQSPIGTTLTRTTLPLPLEEEAAEIGPHRPAPLPTFVLHLQPADTDGISHEESQTDLDGLWKNSTQEGTPIYVTWESTDRDRLEALRTKLFGNEAATGLEVKEKRQADLKKSLDGLPPNQRTAALLQAAMAMKQEADAQFAARYGDLVGNVSPELAAAADAVRLRMEAMAKKVQQKSAANPVDPETVEQMQEYLKGLGGK